jgi:uncharacterized membrane protein YvbJ
MFLYINGVNLMQCPKCQHENRDGAKFCDECGTKVGDTAPASKVVIPSLEEIHAGIQIVFQYL